MSEQLINKYKISDMKKIYICPTTKVGAMMALGFITGSKGNVIGGDFTGDTDGNQGVDGNLTPGDGTDFAKGRSFYGGYDNEW